MNDKKPTATGNFLQILGAIFLGIFGYALWAVLSFFSIVLYFPGGFPGAAQTVYCTELYTALDHACPEKLTYFVVLLFPFAILLIFTITWALLYGSSKLRKK
ncbi:MAG: hypothetical protein AAB802_02320 [Patescibacteria group bacterium]